MCVTIENNNHNIRSDRKQHLQFLRCFILIIALKSTKTQTNIFTKLIPNFFNRGFPNGVVGIWHLEKFPNNPGFSRRSRSDSRQWVIVSTDLTDVTLVTRARWVMIPNEDLIDVTLAIEDTDEDEEDEETLAID